MEIGIKRVLHVITTINRGGAENHLFSLACGQRQRGSEVAIAYLKGDGYWTAELQKAGILVSNLGLVHYGDLRPVFRLSRLIREIRPDIIHAHMPPAELYTRLARLLTSSDPAYVVSKHNDEPFYRGPLKTMLGRWVTGHADRIIAISGAVAGYIQRHLHVPEERMDVVHYGIDTTPYASISSVERDTLRSEWGGDDRTLIIGTVARLVPQKAIDVLLEGYAAYRRRAGQRSRLVIVGVGPLHDDLRIQANKLGIGDEVVWSGFRDDIARVMTAFDVFLLTSDYEGFGLVLLEAMSASRPVVATKVSAIPEIVIEGQTGILVPPRDPQSIAAGLSQLEAPALRREFGQAGSDWARKSFSLSQMVERTMVIYGDAQRNRRCNRMEDERDGAAH